MASSHLHRGALISAYSVTYSCDDRDAAAQSREMEFADTTVQSKAAIGRRVANSHGNESQRSSSTSRCRLGIDFRLISRNRRGPHNKLR